MLIIPVRGYKRCLYPILYPNGIISGCIADGYTTMPWKHRSAGSNPATQTVLVVDVGSLHVTVNHGFGGSIPL